jgi:hypothetical protein
MTLVGLHHEAFGLWLLEPRRRIALMLTLRGEGFGARSVAYMPNSSPSQMRFKESTLMS